MLEDIKKLGEYLFVQHPQTEPKFIPFPSGAAMLYVKIKGIMWVVEYLPTLGPRMGISKVEGDSVGWEGVDHILNNCEEAKQFIEARI